MESHVESGGSAQVDASGVSFYAADDHYPLSFDKIFSHDISSYTTAIKKPKFARERSTQIVQCASIGAVLKVRYDPCIITMQKSPGKAELDGVLAEYRCVEEAAQSVFNVIHLLKPDVLSL